MADVTETHKQTGQPARFLYIDPRETKPFLSVCIHICCSTVVLRCTERKGLDLFNFCCTIRIDEIIIYRRRSMEKHVGIIIDKDGCELEVWLTYLDQARTEPDHVFVVFDGKTISDFPYKMPDNSDVCVAADQIAQGETSHKDLRTHTDSTTLSSELSDYVDGEVLEPIDQQNLPVAIPKHEGLTFQLFQFGSQRLTAYHQNGNVWVTFGVIRICDNFAINKGTSALEIIAQAVLAPFVSEIQAKVAAGHESNELF
jgi:hypothetical protein